MGIGLLFWILAILTVIFGLGGLWGPEPYRRNAWGGFGLILFILVILIGWHDFGPPLRDDGTSTGTRYVR